MENSNFKVEMKAGCLHSPLKVLWGHTHSHGPILSHSQGTETEHLIRFTFSITQPSILTHSREGQEAGACGSCLMYFDSPALSLLKGKVEIHYTCNYFTHEVREFATANV